MIRLAVPLAVAAAASLGWSGASAETPAAAQSCKSGLHRVNGVLVRSYCGPAKATVRVGGKTISFHGGRCTRGVWFDVNVGTATYSDTTVLFDYFHLALGAYTDGTYRDNSPLTGAVRGGYAYAGRIEAFYRLTVVVRGHLSRGRFSGLLHTRERVTGSFSC